MFDIVVFRLCKVVEHSTPVMVLANLSHLMN